MTIAAIWKEGDLLWCVADTRLVVGNDSVATTELAAKIFSIPIATSAFDPSLDIHCAARELRIPHYLTSFGFVYAGAALPASQTAVTASTLLQKLTRPGGRGGPPRFEDFAELVRRLAKRFMEDKRQFVDQHQLRDDGLFSAAFFGWCPHESNYKVAHIDGRVDAGSFRVELSYPAFPEVEGEPWLLIGNGKSTFEKVVRDFRNKNPNVTDLLPLRVVSQMITSQQERTVGGAVSIGVAHRKGFELCCAIDGMVEGASEIRRSFNGLDLDQEIGAIGQYNVVALEIQQI